MRFSTDRPSLTKKEQNQIHFEHKKQEIKFLNADTEEELQELISLFVFIDLFRSQNISKLCSKASILRSLLLLRTDMSTLTSLLKLSSFLTATWVNTSENLSKPKKKRLKTEIQEELKDSMIWSTKWEKMMNASKSWRRNSSKTSIKSYWRIWGKKQQEIVQWTKRNHSQCWKSDISICITFFTYFHNTNCSHEKIFKFFATSNLNTYIVKYQKMKTE